MAASNYPSSRGLSSVVLPKRLSKDFFATGGLKIAHALLGLLVAAVLARSLGPEGYGIYAFYLALASALAIPGELGLPTLLIREAARYQVKEEWARLSGLLRRSNQMALGISLALAIGALSVLKVSDWSAGHVDVWTCAFALPLVPLIALSSLRSGALRGLHKVVQAQVPDTLLRPLLLLTLAMCAPAVGKLTPQMAMALNLVATGLAFCVGALLLYRALPAPVRSVRPSFETAAWLRSVLPLSLISGSQLLNQQADVLMLGVLAGDEDAGVYRVAVQGAYCAGFVFSAVSVVVAPRLARLYAAGDVSRLQDLLGWSAAVGVFTSLPVAFFFFLFGAEVLQVAFGSGFTGAYAPLAVLIVGNVLFAAVGLGEVLLNMTGHERIAATAMASVTVVNILGNLALIPLLGATGAAIATVISLLSAKIYLWVRVRALVGVESSALALRRMPSLVN